MQSPSQTIVIKGIPFIAVVKLGVLGDFPLYFSREAGRFLPEEGRDPELENKVACFVFKGLTSLLKLFPQPDPHHAVFICVEDVSVKIIPNEGNFIEIIVLPGM